MEVMHSVSDLKTQTFPTEHWAKRWLYSAAVLSSATGLIHMWFAPEHFEEWIGYGLFFVISSTAQIIYALVLLAWKPTRSWLLAGIFGNTFIILLYIVTRTLGIPVGPEAGMVEPLGILDVLSKIIEIALIACLIELLQIQTTFSSGRE
jgi:hypothetical protein